MMQTLEMNTEVPYGRVKTWDSSFVKSRRGAYLLTQIVSKLMLLKLKIDAFKTKLEN